MANFPSIPGTTGTPKTMKVTDASKEFFIAQEASESCGAVSYWRAGGDVSIDALRAAWIDAGLDEKLLRKAPDAKTVLRRAVLGLADRKKIGANTEVRTLVRPDAAPHTWAVVSEVVTTEDLPRYTTLLTVTYDSTSVGPQFEATEDAPPGSETYARLKGAVLSAFGAQQNVYDSSDITNWLVKMAYDNGAVTLRDSGGVYFIPKAAMTFWNKAATVIESVTKSQHRVFRIPAMRNNEAMAAIIDAITHEAEQLVALVEAEMVATGDDALGKRALKTRQAQASEMLKKVETYEALVEQKLTVRERVEELQAAIVAASLTGDAGEEG